MWVAGGEGDGHLVLTKGVMKRFWRNEDLKNEKQWGLAGNSGEKGKFRERKEQG